MLRSVIQAGFGNQLFQYATAYALAKEKNQSLELDVSWFSWINNQKNQTFRVNNLDKLNLDCNTFVDNGYSKYRLLTKFKFLKNTKVNGKKVPFILENMMACRENQSYLFDKITKNGAVLYGFWQNIDYFDKYKIDLKRQFTPNYELDTIVNQRLNEIDNCISIGVHIRRGDFVSLGWDKGADYYNKGINWFEENFKDCKFFIVSDDTKWVKGNFSNRKNVIIIDLDTKNKDIDEFFLLSSCKHQLISESTFGWWAAYLNVNKDRKIIVPQNAKGNIFDKDWIRI